MTEDTEDPTRSLDGEDPTLPNEPEATGGLPGELAPGRSIGRYRLVRKVGEGGMGEVWEAEQEKPVRRRVALKVILQGMNTRQIVARFESERQALAMMNHPCIARVFDAGASERGSPYFVMEYVAGVPISKHCDQNRLTARERIELFIQVCEGVQHAHQKAIIHRDLKPSNVLVTELDGKAVPKIIDFGIAKATDQALTEKTLFTDLGQIVGTPEYMSPEQADTRTQDIDTRSDVYSLGVILYQLLAGALPFDSGKLRESGLHELLRVIREVDPPSPSTRVSSLGEASASLARRRSTELPALCRQLKRDLDWIVMKAIEKDRVRRYASPSELAADLVRYLRDEPVMARPPSTAYRVRKFVRRHTAGVAAASLLLLLLVAFAATMAVQARRIAQERDRANREAQAATQVSQFLVNLFRVSDPNEARGNTITAREILDRGAVEIREDLADQPEVQARLQGTMGEVYRNLGLAEAAEPLLREALETRRRVQGEDHPDTLTAMRELAIVYYYLARYEEAEQFFSQSLEGRRRVLGANASATLESMNSLANLYNRLGRFPEAEPLYVAALDAQRRLLGRDHVDTLKTMNNLASLYKMQERFADAEPLARETIETRRRILGADHPDTLGALQKLASIHIARKEYGKAEPLDIEVLEGFRRVMGDEHPETLVQMNNLADLYRLQGHYEKAEPLLIQSLETQRRVLGSDHPDTFLSMESLAHLYKDAANYGKAEPLYLEVLDSLTRVMGPTHEDTLECQEGVIDLYRQAGDGKQARAHLERLILAHKRRVDRSDADAAAKDAYARLLLTCEPAELRDPTTALRYARDANEASGNEEPEFLDTLSLAFHLNGQTARAIENQQRALSRLPARESRLRERLETALAEYEAARTLSR